MKTAENYFVRKKQEIGVDLNEIQQRAVLQTEGPVLLLASPGSGKTTTIIMRIGYLMEEKGVNASRIKAVTFSRASANDMKERFKHFFPDLPPVDFSTIHSLAFEVVREHFWKTRTPYQIIDGNVEIDEQEMDIEDHNLPLHKKIILRDLFKSIKGENITDDQMDELTTYISFIKNKMVPEDQWSLVTCDVPEAARILREYETFKKSGHSKLLLDFDDMLTIGNDVLGRDRELLRKYQQRYDYVMTDESQDTSMVQHEMIEKLAQGHGNLCVVADDDQSIYSWRGAEPSYLLNFKQVYPNGVILFMEQNYRSTKNIVDVSNQFIKKNKNRYMKNMFTQNAEYKPVSIVKFDHYETQSKYLVEEIRKLEDLSEVAVLFRNNSSSINLMNQFDRAGIPFYMRDSDNRFFSHWVVEDILNFMRMTFTDKRTDILEKIHTKLNGYITKVQMSILKDIDNNESVFDNLLNYVPLQDYQIKQIEQCKETFQQLQGTPPLVVIRTIRTKLGYEKALEKMCERLGFRKEYLIGILNTLEEIADTLESMEEFAKRLQHLERALKNSKAKKGQNAVTFSTFHSAKGLEFKRVYMIDLINGIIPSSEDLKRGSRDRNTELMEEAARLFYVGMTRAKSELELLLYGARDGEKVTESTFVSEVRAILDPPKLVQKSTVTPQQGSSSSSIHSPVRSYNPRAIRSRSQLAQGLQVKHQVFGAGRVMDMGSDIIEIQFTSVTKRLSLQACLDVGLLEPIPLEELSL
ncbi:ATP-dependent helicase [Paenibacillus anaericanus]|uniref:DNA 3'-5' helicase n=1 Tax=Paenibacillus anaericanus TaxID=170367 RepID=A0A3S1BVX2_9BACL|nr:ATP-dependent helicase [Paenibacillus anaericanus]RUT48755.1 ATP-dependent helicase [Paenibacillus anaericanus]